MVPTTISPVKADIATINCNFRLVQTKMLSLMVELNGMLDNESLGEF